MIKNLIQAEIEVFAYLLLGLVWIVAIGLSLVIYGFVIIFVLFIVGVQFNSDFFTALIGNCGQAILILFFVLLSAHLVILYSLKLINWLKKRYSNAH